MTATVTEGTTATGNTVPAGRAAGSGGSSAGHARRRRRIGLPRASTTPGQVRLIRAGLVILCLSWGALAALMVGQHASAASDAVGTSEPLSLEAQQMYQSLADADVTVSAGYLYGRTPPFASRQRYQQDFRTAQGEFSTLLTTAATQSTADAAEPITAASHDASSWFAVNQRAQKLDAAFDYGAETQLEIGPGPDTAGTLFGHLESDLGSAIHADQAVFASSASAGSSAFTGLQAGIAVLVLGMAAGVAWGLSRRLAEYR